MRRIAISLALLASLIVPAAASAATQRCTVSISPEAGATTDVYRILVENVPVVPGASVEVRVQVKHLGTRGGAIYFASLIPEVTEFYIDHYLSWEEVPVPDPLLAGRYLVLVSTPHLRGGCSATGRFLVEV